MRPIGRHRGSGSDQPFGAAAARSAEGPDGESRTRLARGAFAPGFIVKAGAFFPRLQLGIDFAWRHPDNRPEHREMVKQVGGLRDEAGVIAECARQRCFDAFFADLLGALRDAVLEQLRRVRLLWVGGLGVVGSRDASPAALEGYLGLNGALAKGALEAPTRERILIAAAEL